MNKIMMIGIVILVILALLPMTVDAIEFRHKPIGPFYLTQGLEFTYDFNATNTSDGSQIIEDGTIIAYTTDDRDTKVSSESLFLLNQTAGVLQYNPSNKDSTKNFTILFLLTDPTLQEVVFESLFVRFIIDNVNDPPDIVNQSPHASITNATENTTVTFLINATDPDFFHASDNMTIEWHFNSILNQTDENLSSTVSPYIVTSEYEAEFGFCDAGTVNISAIVTDLEGLEDMFSWEVNVSNVNRQVNFTGTIPNETWNEGVIAQNHSPSWNLYDFFIDSDYLECTGDSQEFLNFTFDGLTDIEVFVNETTGNITFQSPPYWRGEENITISAFDYDSNATSNTFTLLVNTSGYPPNISLIGNQNAAIGAPFLLYIIVEDPDLLYGDNITYADNSTLFNIEWHNITGNVSYGKIEFTPTAGQEGLYTILIEVEDLYSFTDNQTFTLNISPNNPPELNPIGNQNSTQDTLFNITLSASDLDGDELLFFTNSSLFGLPLDNTTNLYQLNSINFTHAFFNFTPTNEQVGNYTIKFYVYDAIGAIDDEIITFQVININDEPSFIPPLQTDLYTKINRTFVYYANASDPDLLHGDILSFATNDSILNITKISNEQLLINLTPEQSDEGVRTVRVNVTDIDGLYDEWIFNLHILPPIAPVLDAIINISATENEPFISLITATDANDDPLSFSFNDTIWSDYVQIINDTAVLINTTYTKGQVGTYSINVTVTDPDGLYDSTTIGFEVIETDNPPEIEHPGNLLFYEGVLNSVILNVTDLEGDNWTITTNLSDILTIAQINLTNANLTSTPNTSQIEDYKVLFMVAQDSNPNLNTSIIVNLTIMFNPSPPVIESFNPSPPLYIIVNEGTSYEFNATITDNDFVIFENITARWYYKGILYHTEYIESNNQTISLNLTPGFCDAADDYLYLNLTDYYNFTTSMQWELAIQNVNRPPEFGIRRFNAELLSNGSLEGINYSNQKLYLEYPLSSGNLTSNVIDFGSSFNRANLNIIYGNIEAEGVNISGANIIYSIRTGSGSNPDLWDMSWTDYQQIDTQIIMPENLTPKRYAQLRIRINDSGGDYPEIEQILWRYSFGNQTLESSSVYSNWVSLSDFFYDPDDECPSPDLKIPSAEGNIITEVDIDDSDDMTVTLLTEQNTGTEIWWFRFNDGEAISESNNITFTITESEIPPITIPISSGGGGSSTTTITVPLPFPIEIEDPIPIDLIVPESVTIYDNDTIIVPITLHNTLNSTLRGIELRAESDNPNISFSFDQTIIQEISSGENHSVTLTIESYKTYGNYEAVIHAIINEPEFNASKKFFINSIELGRHGDQEYNTRLSFVRDLLSTSPECIELSEQLDQARIAIESGNNQRAMTILDTVSENCRYLISISRTEPQLEEPTGFFSSIRNTPSQMLSYLGIIIIMNLLLGIMFAAFYSHPPRKGMPLPEKKENE